MFVFCQGSYSVYCAEKNGISNTGFRRNDGATNKTPTLLCNVWPEHSFDRKEFVAERREFILEP